MLQFIVSVLIVLGAAFALIGSIGLARFPDVFTRLHGPTKATTLGVGSLVLASVIWLSSQGDGITVREVLIGAFLFLTAPVSAHLLAKAALHRRSESVCELPPNEH
jgi:multicomponent K+:H+ antiporter subunit G